MSEKTKNWLSLLLVLATLAGAVYFIQPVAKSTKLGLDLQGGMYVVMHAVQSKENPVTDDAVDETIRIMRDRIDSLGVTEPQIERYGKNNILIQLPGVKDPEEALEIIKKPAVLEFKEVKSVNESGEVRLGRTLLTGKDLKGARAVFDPNSGAPQVELTFNREGAKEFEKITRSLSATYAKDTPQRRLAIVLDGNVQSAPEVQEAISGGTAVITGLESIDEAKNIALVLQTGAIPLNLKVEQNRVVGATLGQDSLDAGLKAALIGLVLVAIYLLFLYRVYAIMPWFALGIFGTLIWGGLNAMSATLTLPGIAGAILLTGVAADSSIIILERIKDEYRDGRTMRTAIENGFSHGFSTFFDADLVAFVTALALFFFGAGTVKGFALILMLGIAVDLYTAYFFKKPLLGLTSRIKFFQKPWLIGLKERQE